MLPLVFVRSCLRLFFAESIGGFERLHLAFLETPHFFTHNGMPDGSDRATNPHLLVEVISGPLNELLLLSRCYFIKHISNHSIY